MGCATAWWVNGIEVSAQQRRAQGVPCARIRARRRALGTGTGVRAAALLGCRTVSFRSGARAHSTITRRRPAAEYTCDHTGRRPRSDPQQPMPAHPAAPPSLQRHGAPEAHAPAYTLPNTRLPSRAGWSGSRGYFERNAPALSASCRILLPDLRHHGGSGRTAHGRHVGRLAADVRDLLTALEVRPPRGRGAPSRDRIPRRGRPRRHATPASLALLPQPSPPTPAVPQVADATVVGTSMGCAVIWSYIELFGTDRLVGPE